MLVCDSLGNIIKKNVSQLCKFDHKIKKRKIPPEIMKTEYLNFELELLSNLLLFLKCVKCFKLIGEPANDNFKTAGVFRTGTSNFS